MNNPGLINHDINNQETIRMKDLMKNLTKSDKVNRGLCTTCNNAPTCLFYQGNGSRFVWYCETFDDYILVQKSILKTEKKIEPQSEDPDKAVFKGLCMNCAHNTTCTFIKPGGGVWHCDEYE